MSPSEDLVELVGERNIWISLLKLLPPQKDEVRDPDKRQKMKQNEIQEKALLAQAELLHLILP